MAKRKGKPDAHFKMVINGHELRGEKRGLEWTWHCPSWPELETQYEGDTIIDNMVDSFTKRCLAGAIQVRELAGK